jgi:hypothetical protein
LPDKQKAPDDPSSPRAQARCRLDRRGIQTYQGFRVT